MIESFAIHTAVLVGLVVTWLWTERLGGVFAGFAVPGYLGAIALVAPASAATLLIEAVLTYGLVWLLGEAAPRLGVWARVFGRERFLLFVAVSVPVRLLVEGLAAGGLQQLLGPWLPDGAGEGFFSVGLVLVPLLANTFWKPGLVRGLGQVGGTTLLTLALLTVVVMPVLGLEFSSFFLSFEDIALAFLAVPKVYIILLCTAVVATWSAERFGFNAGGLLVPALLGLLVLEPTKLLTTVVEIVVLTALYRVVTSLPGLRGLELSGSRRLVAMYAMAWVLKLSFAFLGQQFEIPVATWNLYGFGYLLSSLVAVRCLDLRPMGRVLLPLGLNIGAGAGVGLGASLVLGWVLPAPAVDPEDAEGREPISVARSVLLAAGSVREDPTVPGSLAAVLRGLPAVIEDPSSEPALAVLRDEVLGPDGATCAHLRDRRADAPGARVWWCGGEGPLLVVLGARSDPDAAWAAAWLLESGAVPGAAMSEVDARTAPARASRLVRALANRLGDRPLLVLDASAPVQGSRVVASGPTGPALALPGASAPLPVAFDDPRVRQQPWWDELRPGDGVLQLDIDEVELAMPVPARVQASLAAASFRDATPVDPRTAWLGLLGGARAARAAPGDAIPAGLAWAASRLGLTGSTALGPTPGWLLVEDEQHRGFGQLLLRPGARSDHVLLAPRAPDEHGTARVALGLAEDLDARAVWWARRRARGLEPAIGTRVDTDDAAPAVLRTLLRPQPGEVGRAVMVRRMTIAVPDPPVAILAEAGEALSAPVPAMDPLLQALDTHYPGWRRSSGRTLEPATVSGLQPLRYAEALRDGRAAVVWIREDVLAEVEGSADREALDRWYGLQGVTRLPLADLGELGAELGRPVDDPGLLRLLKGHFEAPTVASVTLLGEQGQVVMLTDALRLSLAVRTPERVCMARAGAPLPEDGSVLLPPPGPGCWGRR